MQLVHRRVTKWVDRHVYGRDKKPLDGCDFKREKWEFKAPKLRDRYNNTQIQHFSQSFAVELSNFPNNNVAKLQKFPQ